MVGVQVSKELDRNATQFSKITTDRDQSTLAHLPFTPHFATKALLSFIGWHAGQQGACPQRYPGQRDHISSPSIDPCLYLHPTLTLKKCLSLANVQVSKELNRSATQVSEITLNHALRTALGASAARYDDEDVQDRLRARKDRSATGVCSVGGVLDYFTTSKAL